MHILFVNSSLVWGGTEKWTLRAAETLCRRGHGVTIAVRDFALWDPHERGICEFVTLPFSNDADIFTVWKLRRLIASKQIDIFLPTRSRDYWLGGFACMGTRASYVMRMGITRDLRNTVKERLRYGTWPKAIIVNAQAVKDSIARYPWVHAERIHVIYNGVDRTYSLDPVPPLKSAGEFLIVGAGRIESAKGFDILIEALALALREAPALRCAIFGKGVLEDVLERRIRERKIEDRVRMAGFTTNLAGVLKQADLAVSSSYREGVSNFILEAWSSGVPVIATSIPGSAEIVTDGVRGRLVPPGDSLAMSKAILEAYRNPDLRANWIAEGKQAVESTFNWDVMAEQLERVFAGLIL